MMNQYIISCEHAFNSVPEKWSHLFEGSEDVLASHRGWDPGALELAKLMADNLGANLHIYPWTRLLVDPNRSKDHRSIFSEFTGSLPKEQKSALLEKYWTPFRESVRKDIQKSVASGKRVVHLSVHTFTPVWNNEKRNLDIGLLYDPGRKTERDFCHNWKAKLSDQLPDFRIRMNRPYLGSSDGHTTSLRKKFDEENYLGIEIEVNQKYWFMDNSDWNSICENIAESCKRIRLTGI